MDLALKSIRKGRCGIQRKEGIIFIYKWATEVRRHMTGPASSTVYVTDLHIELISWVSVLCIKQGPSFHQSLLAGLLTPSQVWDLASVLCQLICLSPSSYHWYFSVLLWLDRFRRSLLFTMFKAASLLLHLQVCLLLKLAASLFTFSHAQEGQNARSAAVVKKTKRKHNERSSCSGCFLTGEWVNIRKAT